MKKKLVFTLLTVMAASSLVGCQQESTKFEIKFTDAVPNCVTGEEYDFGDILIEEEGVSYTMEAFYQNYYEKKEYKLETNGLKFTQNEAFDVSVVVTGKKGGETKKRTQLVQTSVACDPIDGLLASTGFSGFADTGLTKELITDEQYCKAGGKSALAVYYQGNNFYRWGATVLAPTNFRCLDYWTDKTWEDTILKFWVYNPTEEELEFQLRVADELTKLVNIDWGQELNIIQKAAPGVWTECLFPLHRVGVNHTLFINEEGTRKDSLNVKVRWAGTPTKDPTPLYNYQFYIDGVDFVPASEYPDIDTHCYAKAEHSSESLENCFLDTSKSAGWAAGNVRYDREVVCKVDNPNSKSSCWATFNGTTVTDAGVKYGLIYNIGSDYDNQMIEALPDLTHGILTADFKFENMTNTNVKLVATDKTWAVPKVEYPTEDLGNGWRRLVLDMANEEAYVAITEAIRIGFAFPGVTDATKDTASVHLDNFHYYQDQGSPAKPAMETYTDGLENCPMDEGWNGCIRKFDTDTCASNPNSRYSIKLEFNGSKNVNFGYGITFAPKYIKFAESSYELPNASNSTIEFDVKFSENITNTNVILGMVNDTWDKDGRTEVSVTGTPTDGWYHVAINTAQVDTLKAITAVIRICIYFPGVTDANYASSNVWLDNIFVKTNAQKGLPHGIIKSY